MTTLFPLVPFHEMKETPTGAGRISCLTEFYEDSGNRALNNFHSNQKAVEAGGASLQYTRQQWATWRKAATNCELCGNPFTSEKTKHGDHNHETGKWRGVLCSGCNVMVGYLEKFLKDSVLTEKIRKYLETRGH